MKDVTIRDFNQTDYAGIVTIQNVLYPDRPAVVADYTDIDDQIAKDNHCELFRLVAVQEEKLIGVAQAIQFPWTYRKGAFDITVRVLPDYQPAGIFMIH